MNRAREESMNLVVVTVVKDELENLVRTEKSIRGQSERVTWVIVTPKNLSETYLHVRRLSESGILQKILDDRGQGVYSAMNLAINESGPDEWIWFINAGDEFPTADTYASVKKIVMDFSQSWAYGGHFLGSDEGKILGKRPAPSQFNSRNQLFARKYVSHQSTIFKAELLRQLGGFDTNLQIASDWDLLVRASKLAIGQRIPDEISIFYMGGLSTKNRHLGNMELLQLRKKHLTNFDFLLSYSWFYYRCLRNGLVRSVELQNPTLLNRIRKVRFMIRGILNK